jgi:hypothetical protein
MTKFLIVLTASATLQLWPSIATSSECDIGLAPVREINASTVPSLKTQWLGIAPANLQILKDQRQFVSGQEIPTRIGDVEIVTSSSYRVTGYYRSGVPKYVAFNKAVTVLNAESQLPVAKLRLRDDESLFGIYRDPGSERYFLVTTRTSIWPLVFSTEYLKLYVIDGARLVETADISGVASRVSGFQYIARDAEANVYVAFGNGVRNELRKFHL